MKRLLGVSLAVVLALSLSIGSLPAQPATAGGVFNVPSGYSTIQAGINAAFTASGGTVLVAANNTYNENITLKSGVDVVSDKTGDAIISGSSGFPVVTANSVTNAKLDGFTITNGSGTQLGAGVSIQANSSNVTISNCVITGNTALLRGGGISIDNSSANIVNCTIIGNTANTIAGHGGTGGGIYITDSSPIIINCIIANNTALNAGGGIFVSTVFSPTVSSPTVTNCTLTGNSATDGGGMYNLSSNPTITNSIIYGNTATGSGPNIFDDLTSTPSITYSCVGGGYSGTGNIDADPLFENPGAGNYHLQVGPPLSPCIDAGDNNAPNLPDTDKDGNARIINGTVDMGAYEVNAPVFDAHAIKSEAITKLESAKTGDKKIDKKIDKAIKNIEKSLEDKLWTDTSHPDPKDGEKVFTEEKKAVIELMKIKNNLAVSQAITSLLEVDQTLAQIAIDDAAGGDAERIAKAQKEMTKAQEQIDEGNYDKAIEHYKKAWKHAQKAMK